MQLVVNAGKAKGKFIPITGPRFLIGRAPECQLRPLSDEVSQRHAELKVISGIVVIIDLDSASGTRVNGHALTGPASLRNGDRIEIGPLSFTALLEERKPPGRKRRNMEDEIVSWLIEDEEDEPEVARPRLRPAKGVSAQGRREGSPAVPARTSAGVAAESDAVTLLKAMTTQPD